MEFKEFCIIVEKWKKEGKKLKLKNLEGTDIDKVMTYEVTKDLSQSGTIISFETELSHSHMICEKSENKFKMLNENLCEVKTPNENYQIIVIEN